MKALRQAMEIYQSLSEDCLGYADCLYYFGKLQYRLEDFNNAKSCLEKALEIKRKILPETHSSIALTLNYLGVVYSSLEDKTRAIEYYDKAWNLYHYDPKQFEHVSSDKIRIVHLNNELNVLTDAVAFQVSF
jgi:tetratricopeptide (TPR) repeat protein